MEIETIAGGEAIYASTVVTTLLSLLVAQGLIEAGAVADALDAVLLTIERKTREAPVGMDGALGYTRVRLEALITTYSTTLVK